MKFGPLNDWMVLNGLAMPGKNKKNLRTECPLCHGRGSYLEDGDAHRSTGYVPCRWNDSKQYCSRGRLVEK